MEAQNLIYAFGFALLLIWFVVLFVSLGMIGSIKKKLTNISNKLIEEFEKQNQRNAEFKKKQLELEMNIMKPLNEEKQKKAEEEKIRLEAQDKYGIYEVE